MVVQTRKKGVSPTLKCPVAFRNRTRVACSPIHGVGCFSISSLPRNCLATWYDGELIDWPTAIRRGAESSHYVRSLASMHTAIDGCRDPRRARGHGSFCNHSDIPNAMYWVRDDVVWIKTIKPVGPNQEITVSYGRTYVHSNDQK